MKSIKKILILMLMFKTLLVRLRRVLKKLESLLHRIRRQKKEWQRLTV